MSYQLRLPAPFGLGKGHHISLRSNHEDFDHEATARAITQCGCPPGIVPKVIRCLHYSGRYDCLLQADWFDSYRETLEEQLAGYGVRLIVMHEYRRPRAWELRNARVSFPRTYTEPSRSDIQDMLDALRLAMMEAPFPRRLEREREFHEAMLRYHKQNEYSILRSLYLSVPIQPGKRSLYSVINTEIP